MESMTVLRGVEMNQWWVKKCRHESVESRSALRTVLRGVEMNQRSQDQH